jgi:hypothetical protein
MTPGIGREFRRRDTQARCNLSGDRLRHLALKRQQIVYVALVLLPPEVALSPRFYQLSGNSDAGPGRPNAALDQVAHAQLGTNRLGAFDGLLELHGRGDPETRWIHSAQLGDQLFGHPVADVLLVWIPRQVLEREDGQHESAIRSS